MFEYRLKLHAHGSELPRLARYWCRQKYCTKVGRFSLLNRSLQMFQNAIGNSCTRACSISMRESGRRDRVVMLMKCSCCILFSVAVGIFFRHSIVAKRVLYQSGSLTRSLVPCLAIWQSEPGFKSHLDQGQALEQCHFATLQHTCCRNHFR